MKTPIEKKVGFTEPTGHFPTANLAPPTAVFITATTNAGNVIPNTNKKIHHPPGSKCVNIKLRNLRTTWFALLRYVRTYWNTW